MVASNFDHGLRHSEIARRAKGTTPDFANLRRWAFAPFGSLAAVDGVKWV